MSESNYWVLGHRLSRRTVLLGAALGGGALATAALIGCKSNSKPAASGNTPAQTGTAAPAATLKTGGRLAVMLNVDSPTFDMHTSTTIATNYPTAVAYNQLVQLDPLIGSEKPDGIVPDLAEKWEIAPDGMTYTFHLVKNAKFHDGTPFSADDVKASIERNWQPPKGLVVPRSLQFQPLKSVDVPDPSTVVLKLSRPVSPLSFLPILAQGPMGIYSKKDIVGNFDYKTKMNGTGPYRFKEYVKGNRLSFDKNKEYFVKDRPYLDGVDIFVILDDSNALANTQSGSLDIYNRGSAANVETLKQAMGNKAVFQDVGAYRSNGIDINGKRAPFTDARVRAAITMGTDKASSLSVLAKGDGDLGGLMPPRGPWALSAQELAQIPGYGPYNAAALAEAKKLLAAAGVTSTQKVAVLTRNTAADENVGLFMVEQLKRMGLDARLDSQVNVETTKKLNAGDFDLNVSGGAFALDDPDALFSENYLSSSQGNSTGLGGKELDDLYLAQSQEQDQKKRIELVKNMQKFAIGQHGRIVFFWDRRHGVIAKRVKNYVMHTSNLNNNRYQDVWLDA